MDSEKIDLKTAFALFKDEKHIDRPVMMGVLKDVFMTQLTKTFGSADNFDVIINVDKGDCEIYQNLEVVENVENPNTQISLEEVKRTATTTKSARHLPERWSSKISEDVESSISARIFREESWI